MGFLTGHSPATTPSVLIRPFASLYPPACSSTGSFGLYIPRLTFFVQGRAPAANRCLSRPPPNGAQSFYLLSTLPFGAGPPSSLLSGSCSGTCQQGRGHGRGTLSRRTRGFLSTARSHKARHSR